MRRWHDKMQWLAATGVALLVASCSLALNWDQSQLQCGNSDDSNYAYACLPGYTCDVPYCVANHSRNTGENCSDANQCQPGQVCPLTAVNYACNEDSDVNCQTCNPSCDPSDAWTESACQAGQFCEMWCSAVAQYDSSNLYQGCNPNNWVAGCAKTSTCTANTACTVPSQPGQTQGVCVLIRADNSSVACLPACTISFASGTGTVSDTCGGTSANPMACIPVGANHAAQFVCMPLGDTTQNVGVGKPCNALHPCQAGLACIPDSAAGTSSLSTCYPLCMQGGSTCSTALPGSVGCEPIPFIAQTLYNGGDGSTNSSNASVGYCKPGT